MGKGILRVCSGNLVNKKLMQLQRVTCEPAISHSWSCLFKAIISLESALPGISGCRSFGGLCLSMAVTGKGLSTPGLGQGLEEFAQGLV